jgi:DNA polymerase III subunit epsilon
MRKSEEFTHAIDHFISSDGVVSFRIVPFDESEGALLAFNTYSTAQQKVESWIEEHGLCMRYCGLTPSDSVCFNHQIKKCNGVCAGEEEIAEYNLRASKVVKEHSFREKSFMIVDKGRGPNEHSLVLVENYKYSGYGYFETFEPVSSSSALKEFISRKNYYPDCDGLIRQYLNKSYRKVIPIEEEVESWDL